ncbi:MAG: phosphatase PAP2 family protein [Acidobacteria bacterium]|nr:phosphatase PAP2 family protein [Acidobacteriota bacterium]
MFDGRGKRYFTQGGRAEEFGKIGQTVGGMTFMGPMTAGLFLAGRASHDTRFRAATYDVLQASLVAGAYTTALKLGVGRERPDGSNRLSFPSGHTSHAFAWAAVLDRHYGRRTGVAAYAVAGLIGVSRMERNKHHLSDVLAGATLGWLAGRTVVREDGEAPADGRRFTLAPVADPSGSGVGLGVSLSF